MQEERNVFNNCSLQHNFLSLNPTIILAFGVVGSVCFCSVCFCSVLSVRCKIYCAAILFLVIVLHDILYLFCNRSPTELAHTVVVFLSCFLVCIISVFMFVITGKVKKINK